MPTAVVAATAAAAVASQPDIVSILSSLGVFALAVAAAVGGIYKGLREIKKGSLPPATGSVAAAVLMENSSLFAWTESNKLVAERLEDAIELLRTLDRHGERLVEGVKDHRDALRSATEEQHRLRVATTDLHEFMRSTRRH